MYPGFSQLAHRLVKFLCFYKCKYFLQTSSSFLMLMFEHKLSKNPTIGSGFERPPTLPNSVQKKRKLFSSRDIMNDWLFSISCAMTADIELLTTTRHFIVLPQSSRITSWFTVTHVQCFWLFFTSFLHFLSRGALQSEILTWEAGNRLYPLQGRLTSVFPRGWRCFLR